MKNKKTVEIDYEKISQYLENILFLKRKIDSSCNILEQFKDLELLNGWVEKLRVEVEVSFLNQKGAGHENMEK